MEIMSGIGLIGIGFMIAMLIGTIVNCFQRKNDRKVLDESKSLLNNAAEKYRQGLARSENQSQNRFNIPESQTLVIDESNIEQFQEFMEKNSGKKLTRH